TVELRDVSVMACLEAETDGLSNHRALLARYRLQVLVVIGVDRFAETDVQLLDRPIRSAQLAVAKFKIAHALFVGEGNGRPCQARFTFGVGCHCPAVYAERR